MSFESSVECDRHLVPPGAQDLSDRLGFAGHLDTFEGARE
jgi:hypothetical protein